MPCTLVPLRPDPLNPSHPHPQDLEVACSPGPGPFRPLRLAPTSPCPLPIVSPCPGTLLRSFLAVRPPPNPGAHWKDLLGYLPRLCPCTQRVCSLGRSPEVRLGPGLRSSPPSQREPKEGPGPPRGLGLGQGGAGGGSVPVTPRQELGRLFVGVPWPQSLHHPCHLPSGYIRTVHASPGAPQPRVGSFPGLLVSHRLLRPQQLVSL